MRPVSIILVMLLLGACAASGPAPNPSPPTLQQHEQLVAAIHRRDALAYRTALAQLRPAVNRLMEQRQAGWRALQEPWLRLETLSQHEPLPWAALLREAVLVGEALRRLDESGQQ